MQNPDFQKMVKVIIEKKTTKYNSFLQICLIAGDVSVPSFYDDENIDINLT